MINLKNNDEKKAIKYLEEAAKIAKDATCLRAKCGCVIVKDDIIIGKGFNSPPGDSDSQRKCHCDKDEYHSKVTDKTCCVHAEQRAIMDALKNNSDKLKGSILYFTRIDNKNKIQKSGKPYCTICSKMALDSGIKEFVLWHESGIVSYDTEEYNLISYRYKE